MQIQISWLLQKPTDLERHCLHRQGISGFSRTRVKTDRMCHLQHQGYPKRDEQESLPYRVDVQADLSLFWSRRSYCRFCHALVHILVIYRLKVVSHSSRQITICDADVLNAFLTWALKLNRLFLRNLSK